MAQCSGSVAFEQSHDVAIRVVVADLADPHGIDRVLSAANLAIPQDLILRFAEVYQGPGG